MSTRPASNKRASLFFRERLPSVVYAWGTKTISLPRVARKGVIDQGAASRAYPPPAFRNDMAEK